MPQKFKWERNKQIVKLKDRKKWSYGRIGQEFGLRKQTVHSIYTRTKKKLISQ